MRKVVGLILMAFVFCSCSKSSYNPSYVQVFNKGVPGNTTALLLARLNDIFGINPDLVIIMIGTNDSGADSHDFQNYPGNLSKLIDTIKGRGISVMLLTPPPIQVQSSYYFRTGRLDSICKIVTNLSNTKPCYFVDVNSNFKKEIAQAGSPNLYIDDGLHPNATGYSIIGGYISGYLKSQHLKKVKIVCFGDSITYGVNLIGAGTSSGYTYPAVLQRNLNLLYNFILGKHVQLNY